MLRYIAWGFCMGFQELTFQQKMYCFGFTGKWRHRIYVKAKHLTVWKNASDMLTFFIFKND